MLIRPLARWLCAAVAIAATSMVARAQGVIIVEDAVLNIEPVQSGGHVAACGIHVKAPHAIGAQAVRTWELTLYITDYHNGKGIAVNASSYDEGAVGAPPTLRPAPTELAFSVKGNNQVFTATEFRPSQPQGESLALLKDKGASQIVAALEVGTPVVLFFRPGSAGTEAVIFSGKFDLNAGGTFGHCIQAMEHP